ncbi:GIY-YIG nuclease family protein [Elusimicrobiota bacterium]
MANEGKWFVYIVECSNRAYYTGITNDINRRLNEHNSGNGGRYTRAFGPVRLLWKEKHPSRSSASKREVQIKGWSRMGKKKLFERSKAYSIK